MKLPLAWAFLLVMIHASAGQIEWPQFRGPKGSGVAEGQKPPIEFGPKTNVVWEVNVPPGASSPCITGDRLFLTAFDNGELQTLCYNRRDGKVLWRKTAPAERIERFLAEEGSPAASTPVTDGERVYVYFGSCGVFCYDLDGKELWRHNLPAAESFGGFGTGTSPVLAKGLIIVNRDQTRDSQVIAIDAATGKQAWATDRGQSYGWCTPAIWEHDGMAEVVLPASAVVKSYDLKTGAELWQVRGTAAGTCATPVVGDGLLFVSSWTPAEGSAFPQFSYFLEKSDKNSDGAISLEESEGTDLRTMFRTLDLNDDKRVTEAEYNDLRALMNRSRNVLVAVRPGGKGDSADTHVVWQHTKGLPYVPSPLFYDGRLYLVKDGGLATCLDGRTGKVQYQQERLGAAGSYYASPIAADGRIYATSLAGVAVVFKAGDTLEVLARNDLAERVSATPAVANDTLYVRTAKRLFAFGAGPAVRASAAAAAAPFGGEAADDTVALLDGRSLKGWKQSDFTGSGKVRVEDGKIILESGFMTGITWTNEVTRMDYEINLEAMRVEGSDFFCGLTFPVGESACSLIVGGWGGGIVGLSSLDYMDAANNETTKFMKFETGKWYPVRVRVEPERIQAWVDGKVIADVKTKDRKVSIRAECEPSLPLGIATYGTTAAIRGVTLKLL